MLELFINPIVAFIIYVLGSIIFFTIGYIVSGKKSNTMLFISVACMGLSIMCLVLTLNNIMGSDTSLKFLVPVGAIVWGLTCLNVVQKRQDGSY